MMWLYKIENSCYNRHHNNFDEEHGSHGYVG